MNPHDSFSMLYYLYPLIILYGYRGTTQGHCGKPGPGTPQAAELLLARKTGPRGDRSDFGSVFFFL